MIQAVGAVVHQNMRPKKALDLYETLKAEEAKKAKKEAAKAKKRK